jgi:hypothetical protein
MDSTLTMLTIAKKFAKSYFFQIFFFEKKIPLFMLWLEPVVAGCLKAEVLKCPQRLSCQNELVWCLDKVVEHFLSYTWWIRQQVLCVIQNVYIMQVFKIRL